VAALPLASVSSKVGPPLHFQPIRVASLFRLSALRLHFFADILVSCFGLRTPHQCTKPSKSFNGYYAQL
jgi:hypothetical protein